MKGDIFTRISENTIGTGTDVRPRIESRFVDGSMTDFSNSTEPPQLEALDHNDFSRTRFTDNKSIQPVESATKSNTFSAKPSDSIPGDTSDGMNKAGLITEEIRQEKDSDPLLGSSQRHYDQQALEEIPPAVGETGLLVTTDKDENRKNDRESVTKVNDPAQILPGDFTPAHESAESAGSLTPLRPRMEDQNFYPLSARKQKEKSIPAAPTIRVTIGRVDVFAETKLQSPRHPTPKRKAPSLSLDDYLKQRNEGRR